MGFYELTDFLSRTCSPRYRLQILEQGLQAYRQQKPPYGKLAKHALACLSHQLRLPYFVLPEPEGHWAYNKMWQFIQYLLEQTIAQRYQSWGPNTAVVVQTDKKWWSDTYLKIRAIVAVGSAGTIRALYPAKASLVIDLAPYHHFNWQHPLSIDNEKLKNNQAVYHYQEVVELEPSCHLLAIAAQEGGLGGWLQGLRQTIAKHYDVLAELQEVQRLVQEVVTYLQSLGYNDQDIHKFLQDHHCEDLIKITEPQKEVPE